MGDQLAAGAVGGDAPAAPMAAGGDADADAMVAHQQLGALMDLVHVVGAVIMQWQQLHQVVERQVKSTAWYDLVVPSMSPARFRRAFRVTSHVAQDALDVIRQRDEFKASKCNVATITSPAKQLLMTLYSLGRDVAYHQLSELFGVSEGSAWNSVSAVVKAIHEDMGNEVSGLWPSTPEARAAAAAGMATAHDMRGRRHRRRGGKDPSHVRNGHGRLVVPAERILRHGRAGTWNW